MVVRRWWDGGVVASRDDIIEALVRELLDTCADLMCLQEVQADHYEVCHGVS